MKIGIGVITMGVRNIHPNIPGKCDPHALIRIQTDHTREGIAPTRNVCLEYLYQEGCDVMFLFDDDCYPIMTGWEQHFIAQAQAHDLHYLGLPYPFESRLHSFQEGMGWWDKLLGCFSFQTRALVDKIGYFNVAYQRYGHEDQGRLIRARRAGMCGEIARGYAAPLRACSYIYSEDAYHANPTPNLTKEEKAHWVELNRSTWEAEVASDRLYYPPR